MTDIYSDAELLQDTFHFYDEWVLSYLMFLFLASLSTLKLKKQPLQLFAKMSDNATSPNYPH